MPLVILVFSDNDHPRVVPLHEIMERRDFFPDRERLLGLPSQRAVSIGLSDAPSLSAAIWFVGHGDFEQ